MNILKGRFRLKWWWILIILIIVGGIGVFVFSKNKDEEKTFVIKKGEVVEELILSGEIKAVEHAQLAFQSGGLVSWMGVKEGDYVRKGQALAKLDTVALNASYQRALSDLRAAEATVDRVHDDVKDNDTDETFLEKETRTTAEVAKDKAYDAVVAARRALVNATLVAPFEGIVTYVNNPFSGINANISETQIEIVGFDSVYFEVSADQTEVTMLSVGQEVEIVLDSFPEEIIKGKISHIGGTPKSGESGTIYGVKVTFLKVNLGDLKIGMTGDAKFITGRKENTLYVAPEFISSDKEGDFVIAEKGKKIYIETGLEGEERTEIDGEGISEGMTIYD